MLSIDVTYLFCGEKFFFDHNVQEERSLWIHVHEAEDVVMLQPLLEEIKKILPEITCFLSSDNTEISGIARWYKTIDYFKVLPDQDDLEKNATFLKSVNPFAILTFEHDIPPLVLMLAGINNIPVFLLNASFSHRIERFLVCSPHLYVPIFNTFTAIFTQNEMDIENFIHIGITRPKMIPLASLAAFNIMKRKEELRKKYQATYTTIKAMLPGPVILIGSLYPSHLNLYVPLFREIKKNHPFARMIIAPHAGILPKCQFIEPLKKLSSNFYLWDEYVKSDDNFADLITNILMNHEIILSCIPGQLFNLFGIADVYISHAVFESASDIIEAAAWQVKTLVCTKQAQGTTALKAMSLIYKTQENFIEQALRTIETNTSQDTKESFEWVQQISLQAEQTINYLIGQLKQEFYHRKT